MPGFGSPNSAVVAWYVPAVSTFDAYEPDAPKYTVPSDVSENDAVLVGDLRRLRHVERVDHRRVHHVRRLQRARGRVAEDRVARVVRPGRELARRVRTVRAEVDDRRRRQRERGVLVGDVDRGARVERLDRDGLHDVRALRDAGDRVAEQRVARGVRAGRQLLHRVGSVRAVEHDARRRQRERTVLAGDLDRSRRVELRDRRRIRDVGGLVDAGGGIAEQRVGRVVAAGRELRRLERAVRAEDDERRRRQRERAVLVGDLDRARRVERRHEGVLAVRVGHGGRGGRRDERAVRSAAAAAACGQQDHRRGGRAGDQATRGRDAKGQREPADERGHGITYGSGVGDRTGRCEPRRCRRSRRQRHGKGWFRSVAWRRPREPDRSRGVKLKRGETKKVVSFQGSWATDARCPDARTRRSRDGRCGRTDHGSGARPRTGLRADERAASAVVQEAAPLRGRRSRRIKDRKKNARSARRLSGVAGRWAIGRARGPRAVLQHVGWRGPRGASVRRAASVTWPLCDQPLKRSTTYVRPLDPSVRYGVSICAMLPRQMILVPGPARVISVFICFGVRFCASSMIRNLLRNVRPRMKLSDLILMRAADQVLRRRAAPVAAVRIVGLVEHVEVVVERAHPRRHLLFLGARQEADVLADRHRHARDDDFGVGLGLQHLRQAGRQREQRLAGAGLAEQRDEVAFRIHQQVQREVLLAVAGGDAPDAVLLVAVVAQRLAARRSCR